MSDDVILNLALQQAREQIQRRTPTQRTAMVNAVKSWMVTADIQPRDAVSGQFMAMESVN